MEQSKLEITQKTAQQIKYLRLLNGLSQEALAHSAGLNATFLGHIERSLKCPTVDTLNKIATALNMSLSELLDFDRVKQTGSKTDRKSSAIQKINALIQGLSPREAEQIAELIEKIIRFRI